MSSTRTYSVSAILLALTGILLVTYGVYAFLTPQIVINWSTATEFETAGYFVYRSSESDGDYTQLNDLLITGSPDPLSGGDYEFVDNDVRPGQTYYYILQEVEFSGNTNPEGPIEATAAYRGVAEAGLGLLLILFAFYTSRLGRQSVQQVPDESPAA